MTFMSKITAVSAIALLAPVMASAVPISADMPYTVAGILPVGGTTTFTFEVTEALDIANFAINATDTNGGGDIVNASFDYNTVSGDTFDTVFSSSGVIGDSSATGNGFSFVPGWGGYNVGDVITFTFNDGIDDNISLGLSFQTTSPVIAPVPLPAGGLLLGSMLLGAGFLAKRRKA